MKFCKILSLVLAVLMLASAFVACGESTEPNETQANTKAPSGNDGAETEPETVDPVEEALGRLTDIDWGNEEFCVLFANDIAGYAEEVQAEAEASDQTSSAVINDAVYERNILLEDRCNLIFMPIPSTNPAIPGEVNAECQTNNGDYDLVLAPASTTSGMATSGFLYNYLDMEIDYE